LNYKEETILYKILFEALSNISKHANASHAELFIHEFSDSIKVEIQDNGIGFQLIPVIQSGHAFGLKSIMDNCILLNSSAYIDSENNGTKISFQIPFTK
jgi:NarL family two-component system sensor histidine kinase YdfH